MIKKKLINNIDDNYDENKIIYDEVGDANIPIYLIKRRIGLRKSKSSCIGNLLKRIHLSFSKCNYLDYVSPDEKYMVIKSENWYIESIETKEKFFIPVDVSYYDLHVKYNMINKMFLFINEDLEKSVFSIQLEKNQIKLQTYKGYCDAEFLTDGIFLLNQEGESEYIPYNFIYN